MTVKSIIFTIISVLSCPKPTIVNKTDVWNDRDQKTFDFAANRCKVMYREETCMVTFIKSEDSVYSVICGKRR